MSDKDLAILVTIGLALLPVVAGILIWLTSKFGKPKN